MSTESTGPRIEGRVAAILNKHQVVINVGKNDSVEKDMLFDVLDGGSQVVRDPETKEVLCRLEISKKRLRVSKVLERAAIATTLSRKVNVGGEGIGMGGIIDKLYGPPDWVTKRETLEGSAVEPISEKDSVVKRGDPVVQVGPSDVDKEGLERVREVYAAEDEPDGVDARSN